MRDKQNELDTLRRRAVELEAFERDFHRDAEDFFKGKQVRITCPRYNGQPCGTSKPKLQGAVLTVAWVTAHRGEIWIGFSEYRDGIGLSGVELLS